MPEDMLEKLFDLQAELNKRIGYHKKALREDFDDMLRRIL